ncbi:MAG TPA: hypothetical protein VGM62_15140, partial [Chthoniobacterales bacterium]
VTQRTAKCEVRAVLAYDWRWRVDGRLLSTKFQAPNPSEISITKLQEEKREAPLPQTRVADAVAIIAFMSSVKLAETVRRKVTDVRWKAEKWRDVATRDQEKPD